MVEVEKISAFMDGEIVGDEASTQVGRLKDDEKLRAGWDTYHLIGDTLRGEKFALPAGFLTRLRGRLADEPTVLAPQGRVRLQPAVRRFALPVAASVGGIALVAWLALFSNPFSPQKNELVASQQVKTQTASREVNDYLLAHQQFASSTVLPGVASYVRTVSGDAEAQR